MGKRERKARGEGELGQTVLTPPEVFNPCLVALGRTSFDLDPCSHPGSVVPADVRIMLPVHRGAPTAGLILWGDGLERPWSGAVFENPPYVELQHEPRWLSKLATEASPGIAYLPARTSGAWWHEGVLDLAEAIVFLHGRVKHIGEKHHSPFHQVLALYNTGDLGPWVRAFDGTHGKGGRLVRLR